MSMKNFISLVQENNIRIYLPKHAHFSFATSPYHAHQHGVALDIYQDLSLTNFTALSPIKGKVIKTRALRAPTPRFQGGISKEYVTLIENAEDRQLLYKILHVKPKIKKGTVVNVGDTLGETIKNGYFAPWSSPHLHLELRTKKHPFRARGGKKIPFNLLKSALQPLKPQENNKPTYQVSIKIKAIHSNYYLGVAPASFYTRFNDIFGLSGRLKGEKCILDGGIPLYKNGIVLFSQKYEDDYLKSPVYLGPHEIGQINGGYNNFYFYRFKELNFYLGEKKLRGISLFLGFTAPLIKLIPATPSDMELNEKVTYKLRISAEE